jgi:hypothetical protein
VSGFDVPDSGYDPIASKTSPYKNIFYTTITDKICSFHINANSLEWWQAFTTTLAYSALWMRTYSIWTRVNTLSSLWELGYNSYLTLKTLSGRWISTYTTVSANSALWGSPYLMFTNKIQTYTHSKTFSGQTLSLIDGISSYGWNLDTQQVSFVDVDKDLIILNPNVGTCRTGGVYTIVLKNPLNYKIYFDDQYVLNEHAYERTLSGIIVVNFNGIDDKLYGDVTILSAVPLY